MLQHDRDSRHPEFEFVDPSGGAIHYLEHGYPHPLVRWHFHNEYELHYIVASSGKVFVGDYIGEFKPGNLILAGPRLPHNWISNPDRPEQLALRDMVVQFEHATIERAARLLVELREVMPLLERAQYGIEFHGMEGHAEHFMHAIRESSGPTRLGYFCQFLHVLAECEDFDVLSTVRIESKIDEAAADKINTVVNFVMQHYSEDLSLDRMAGLVGMNASYFSRFFRRSTGNTFNEFVTQIRVSKACELLSTSEQQISHISYAVGYNNIANFNRRFRERKHVTPREYRRHAKERLTRGAAEATS